jgi:hypothetical protein
MYKRSCVRPDRKSEIADCQPLQSISNIAGCRIHERRMEGTGDLERNRSPNPKISRIGDKPLDVIGTAGNHNLTGGIDVGDLKSTPGLRALISYGRRQALIGADESSHP